jgi:putative Mg2+ transporter-C (MgtC) family protein
MAQPIISELELDLIVKVVIAAVFGLMIGIERKGGHSGAGMRTFSLIALGSALFTVIGVHAFSGTTDQSRIPAQIVTGMGFIGAGVIWRQRMEAIHGITTAAAIWVAAAIGIAVGVGLYPLAFAVTLMTMLILARGHPLKEAKQNILQEQTG